MTFSIIFSLGVIALIFGVLLTLWKVLRELEWLKAVLIPFMSALAQFINPGKK